MSFDFCCCCQQGQGHSEGSYNQNTTVVHKYGLADPFATKHSFMVHHHHCCCVQSYVFLCHRSLCNQTGCVDVLLLIIKPSVSQVGIYWHWQEHSDLQYCKANTEIRGWGGCCLTQWQTLFLIVLLFLYKNVSGTENLLGGGVALLLSCSIFSQKEEWWCLCT